MRIEIGLLKSEPGSGGEPTAPYAVTRRAAPPDAKGAVGGLYPHDRSQKNSQKICIAVVDLAARRSSF